MPTFNDRLQLTQIIDNYLNSLFNRERVVVQEFGCSAIVGDNETLFDYIKLPDVNQQPSAMIVKYAPDYLVLKNSCPKELFFLDVKHSISPIYALSRLEMLRTKNNDNQLSIDRIGVVAREALLSYRRFYPNTIILMACPYNKKLLMAQFADRVRCLYCYRSPGNGDYNCDKDSCPSKNGGYFDLERAGKADDSQTPMTNVDLDSFVAADEFFESIGIDYDNGVLEELKEKVKNEQIQIGNQVDRNCKNKILWNLHKSGCDWIDYMAYVSSGDVLYHIDGDCRSIHERGGNG